MPNSSISASGLNRNNKRVRGVEDSRVQVILTGRFSGGLKRISNNEHGMSNDEVSVRYSLFLVRYSAVLFMKSFPRTVFLYLRWLLVLPDSFNLDTYPIVPYISGTFYW